MKYKEGKYLILNKKCEVVCECNSMYDAEMIVRNNNELSWLFVFKY